MRRLTPQAHSIIAPAFLSGYAVKYAPPPRGTLNASGTSWELVNVIVATPWPVKMDEGRLPVGVFIPMISGNGPFPVGVLIVALKVIEVEPCIAMTVSLPPEKVAVRLVGGAPFGPDSQYWMMELISARRQRHWSFVVMRVPFVIRNGSGRFAIAGSALKATGADGAGQSAPVFSLS